MDRAPVLYCTNVSSSDKHKLRYVKYNCFLYLIMDSLLLHCYFNKNTKIIPLSGVNCKVGHEVTKEHFIIIDKCAAHLHVDYLKNLEFFTF